MRPHQNTYTVCTRIPDQADATAYYRAVTPLSELRRRWKHGTLHVSVTNQFSGSVGMFADIAFFQRPATKAELEAIQIFKSLGKPVIVDYDDLLIDVPSDNPTHGAYSAPEFRATFVEILAAADAVIVSTNELKRCLQVGPDPLAKRVYVVPNALDDTHLFVGGRDRPASTNELPMVLWRGSQTHQRDLFHYTPELVACAAAHRETSFLFAGYNPWMVTDQMGPQAVIAPPLPIGSYMEFLYKTAPKIGIVPLHRSRFNMCKSNIAWLEMTWAGAACLVPDWEEWRNPGAVGYEDAKSFGAGLSYLLEQSPEKLRELNASSWEHIRENYLLSHVNHTRHEIFLAALGLAEWPGDGGPIEEFYK